MTHYPYNDIIPIMTNHKRQYNKRQRLNPNLIKHLNLIEGWSLAEIARFFDVSRQHISFLNKKLDKIK